jgi:hypothetical protein
LLGRIQHAFCILWVNTVLGLRLLVGLFVFVGLAGVLWGFVLLILVLLVLILLVLLVLVLLVLLLVLLILVLLVFVFLILLLLLLVLVLIFVLFLVFCCFCCCSNFFWANARLYRVSASLGIRFNASL